MKTYQFTDAPFEVCGLDVINPQEHNYWRLPDEETKLVSDAVRDRSKTACGGRIRFRTDSKSLYLNMTLYGNSPDGCIPMCGSAGADVLRGIGENSVYVGVLNPHSYENLTPNETFRLSGDMEQITINLPRNERIAAFEIGIDDDAQLLPPVPYSRAGKLCFYGSSITEGGCCSRVGNAYAAAVSRWLDMDYVNYGFSGSARGEDAMADIITRRDFNVLIMDYDHNAPTLEHLIATHQRFFRRIRQAKPNLPILMLSKPDFDANPAENTARRNVILKTYLDAMAEGDENVWFLDGEQLFGTFGREMCTVDNCHPNDLGSFRMAEKVYGVLLRILR